MEDDWKFYEEIDFSDEKIKIYHIDTRDFHCITSTGEPEKKMDFAKIKKYPERFLHTADEVKALLSRFFNESGGKVKWRFLMLDSTDKKMDNWNLKYIRIHRTDSGLVVCDNRHYALNKEILSCPVNKEHLSAH